jgi:adhesin transport system outer membrane protein
MKKKMRTIWLSALIAGGTLFSQQAAFAQSLAEVVDQTIKTNPDVLIDVNRRLEAEQNVLQAKGGYQPKVDLGLGIGGEWSENISTRPGHRTLTRTESSLTLSQMLYDGYGVKSEVDRQESRVESAAYKVAGTSEQIGLRAVETYLAVLRRQEQLDLIQDNLAAHERTYQQIKLRADSGVGRKADLEQIQARLSLSQANLASAQANLREAKINFLRVVGSMPKELDKPTEVNCELFPATVDEAIDAAFANHPILRSTKADIDATKAQTGAAQSALKPRVDLELGTSWNRNLDGVDYKNNDAYAMLRLRHNLYRGGSDQARISETKIQTQEAIEIMNRTRRQVEESTRLSWNALETAIDRLPKIKAQAEATERTRDAYAQQFNIGQRTLLDLLDSENELYTARSNYVDAQYVGYFARYRLMTDMGKLLETLGVAPCEASKLTSMTQSAAPDEKPH